MNLNTLTMILIALSPIGLYAFVVRRRHPNRRARQFRSFWAHWPGPLLPGTLDLLRKTDEELEDHLRHADQEPIR